MRQGPLKNRNFRALVIGQAISQFGDALYYLVFTFMVLKLTGSEEKTGHVMILQALPFLLLSSYAGVIADRHDRRKILLACDIASACILAIGAIATFLVRPIPVWVVFVLAGSLSVVNAFFLPAKSAAIPRLVEPNELVPALSLSASIQSIMPLLGLVLSAIAIAPLAKFGDAAFFGSALVFNLASFLGSAWFIQKLPPIPRLEAPSEHHVLNEIVDGFRAAKDCKPVFVSLLLTLGLNLFVGGFMLIFVVTNREWFGDQYGTFVMIEAAFGLGLLAGSLTAPMWKIRRPGLALAYSLAAVGGTVLAMGFSRNAFLFSFWNFAAGLVLPLAQIPFQAYTQMVIPDEKRGRVSSIFAMTGMGIAPISILVTAAMLEKLGIANSFLVIGAGMALMALLGLLSGDFRAATLPSPEEIT